MHRTLKHYLPPKVLLKAGSLQLRHMCSRRTGQRACPHYSVLGKAVAVDDILTPIVQGHWMEWYHLKCFWLVGTWLQNVLPPPFFREREVGGGAEGEERESLSRLGTESGTRWSWTWGMTLRSRPELKLGVECLTDCTTQAPQDKSYLYSHLKQWRLIIQI